MPDWVRRMFIQKLPKLLFMRVPIQVIKNSMSTGRRSKFLRQSDPALKTLTGKGPFVLVHNLPQTYLHKLNFSFEFSTSELESSLLDIWSRKEFCSSKYGRKKP